MSYMNDLRELVKTQLQTLPGSAWDEDRAPRTAYPYKTYKLGPTVITENGRRDTLLTVNVYDRQTNKDRTEIEDLADQVEHLFFRSVNLPQEHILPTFWLVDRQPMPEENLDLQRIELTFQVQTYLR